MAYIPHAAIGAVKILSGSANDVTIKTNSDASKGGGKYAVYLTVSVFGVPGSRRLRNVRYFGPLSFTAGTKTSTETRQSPPGFYDALIEWATTGDQTLEGVFTQMREQLSGLAVTAQNIGGRWLIR